MCHRVGGVWLFFVFWVEHLLVKSLKWWSARACDDFKRLCFPFLCWLVVGALLGVWDDTCCCSCLQVAACCGQAAVVVVCVWCVGVV